MKNLRGSEGREDFSMEKLTMPETVSLCVIAYNEE